MKALGALAVAFSCFVQCTLGGKPDGNPKSKNYKVIRGMTAVCYDPKDVCYFHPCQNGGTCSPPKANDGDKPYTCHCFLGFGGVSCEKRQVLLRVLETKPREVELSVTKSDDGHWAAYITELVNLRNLKPLEFRKATNSGRVTRITLHQLEPGTPYRVRVRPVENFKELPIWIDETTFNTRVELKIDSIQERQAVLSVVTSNSTGWSNYTVKITPPKGREETTTSHQISGNVTEIDLPRLDVYTKYIVRVAPVLDDGTRLREWANEVSFETLPTYPSFTKEPPSSIFLISGENVSIQCNASGIPQPVVKWIRRSSPPPNGRQHDNGGVLKISNALPRDSGDYECVASNKRGVIRASTLRLVVPRPVHLRIGEGEPGEAVLLVTPRDGAPWTEYDVKFRARVANATSKQLFRRAVTPANVIRMNLFYLLPTTLYSVRVRPVKDGNLKGKWSNELRGVRTPQESFYIPSDSVILKNHTEYKQKLHEYLKPVRVWGKQWQLCFRASEHQYRARAFHEKCDNKGPTVTLVRVGDNVFGGYTDKSWDGDEWYTSSDEAFLFSLRNRVGRAFKMALRRGSRQRATYGRSGHGPGFGTLDLLISDNCHTGTWSASNPGYTYQLPAGYTYDTPQARSLLAGSFDFKCNEYEVFYRQ